MEVSDAFSILEFIKDNKPIRITKLKHFTLNDYIWNNTQRELFADAVRHCASLKSLRLSLADYDLVYLLRDILVAHPTIRSITFEAENNCNLFLEKMIQDAQWTELAIVNDNDEPKRSDFFHSICRGLMKNTTITTLDLSKCHIAQFGIDRLEELFKVNNTINTLLLDVDSEYASLTELAEVLEEKKQLISFSILGGGIEYSGITNWTNLARALRANTSLTHLELHPHICDDGAQDLVELIHNNHLKSLEADMEDADVSTIYEAMLANTSLTSLDLKNCTSDCDLVSEVIKAHPSLQHLSFSFDCDDESETLPVINALKHNKSITSLNIANCTFGSMWHELYGMFVTNTTIQHLTISNNCLHRVDWNFLKETLRSSKTLKSFTYTKYLPSSWNELCQGLQMNQSLTSVYFKLDEAMTSDPLNTLLAALVGNTTLRSLTIEAEDVILYEQPARTFYDNLNLESVTLILRSNRHQAEIQQIELQGFERKAKRRREVTDLIVSLFNIVRRPESFELFPAEIWLQIFNNLNSSYLSANDVAAILQDRTIRKIVDFDKDDYFPPRCNYDSLDD